MAKELIVDFQGPIVTFTVLRIGISNFVLFLHGQNLIYGMKIISPVFRFTYLPSQQSKSPENKPTSIHMKTTLKNIHKI